MQGLKILLLKCIDFCLCRTETLFYASKHAFLHELRTAVLLNSQDETLESLLKLTRALPLIPAGLRFQLSAWSTLVLPLLSCVLVADLITLHCFMFLSNE